MHRQLCIARTPVRLSTAQKRYSGTGHNTTPIELFTDEVRKSGLTVQNVSKVHVVLPVKRARAREAELSARGPVDPPQRAHSSLAYCLARVLLDGGIDTVRFDDERIVNDTDVLRTIQKNDGRVLARESEFFTFRFPPEAWGEWLATSGKRLLAAESAGAAARSAQELGTPRRCLQAAGRGDPRARSRIPLRICCGRRLTGGIA